MIDIDNLTKEEKIELLSKLLNDSDTIVFSEAEFQHRIQRILQKVYDALEEYLKEVDKIRSEERKNMWTTTKESWISYGRAEVCARIMTILREITIQPSLTDEAYEILNLINKKKNDIVNNNLSDSFRGNRDVYQRLLRFEGKCADAIENEWSNAFLLGLESNCRVTDEQLKKIRDNEKEIVKELYGGTYDKNRLHKEIAAKIKEEEDERRAINTKFGFTTS